MTNSNFSATKMEQWGNVEAPTSHKNQDLYLIANIQMHQTSKHEGGRVFHTLVLVNCSQIGFV